MGLKQRGESLVLHGGESGVLMNGKVKQLIQQLGEAIRESVSDSESISGVVQEIREQGFDVLLMLEATIGLNEVTEAEEVDGDEEEAVPGSFTQNDVSFLRSLRISLPEGDFTPSDSDPSE